MRKWGWIGHIIAQIAHIIGQIANIIEKIEAINLIIAQIVHLFEKNGMNLPYEYPIEGFEKQHLGKSQN